MPRHSPSAPAGSARRRLPACAGLLLAATFFWAAAPARAFQQTPFNYFNPETGFRLEVALPLRSPPAAGFFPIHVTITNDAAQARTWQCEWSSGGNYGNATAFRHSNAITVGPGETRQFDLLVPRAGLPTSRGYHYDHLQGKITGHGLPGGSARFGMHSNSSGGVDSGYIAISSTLANASWSKLEAELQAGKTVLPLPATETALLRLGVSRTGRRALKGSPVVLAEMPPDARAFSGITGLWLTEADWREASSPRRAAVRQWIDEGGRLFIATSEAAPSLLGLPAGTRFDTATPAGFGSVKLVKLEGGELPIAATVQDIFSLDESPLPAWREDFNLPWKALQEIGVPSLNVPLLISFVCLFGVVIGPLNLLWLAPAQRRHRLFLTVPLISAGASIALLGVIAVGDGIGGVGVRSALLLLPAGENRATLVQEQAARSRLLLSRNFAIPEETVVADIPIERGRANDSGTLLRAGGGLGGEWFQSRAVQAMSLRLTMPSRAAVTLQPLKGPSADAGPILVSTASGTLRDVHWIDSQSRYWHIASLATGRPGELRPSSRAAFDEWLVRASAELSGNLRSLLESTAHRPGYFYAMSDPMPGTFIETLPSISWKKQTVVCLGPCLATQE